MADALKPLSELITLNNQNAIDVGATDLLNEAPFLQVVHSMPASNGTQHKYVKKTGAPSVGFRAVNAGIDATKSTDALVSVDLKLLDATFPVDSALADAYVGGREAYMAREAMAHLRQMFFKAEATIFGGTLADEDGFSGLADALSNSDDDMVIDATGSTNNTASSVYLIRSTPDERDLAFVAGNSGNVEIGETFSTYVEPSGGGRFHAYVSPISAWMGLQVGGAHSVARICNLTEDSGKGLTDDLIYRALSLFPASRMPTHIVMNRRSLRQLRQSRTTHSPTGTPAPFPRDVEGVPIVVTDAIGSTEALLTAA